MTPYCHHKGGKVIHVRLQSLTNWQAALFEFRDPRTRSNLGLTFSNLIKTEMESICAHVCSCVEGITGLERVLTIQFHICYPVKFQSELLVPGLVANWLPIGLTHNCVVQLQNGTDFICYNTLKTLFSLI